MINGVHAILYSPKAEVLRAFFRDVLERPAVDAGHGWLIFALPPAELAVHPAEADGHHELFLMCDDIQSTIQELKDKGVTCTPVSEQGWGSITRIQLPDGSEIGLYQPKHPTAHDYKR